MATSASSASPSTMRSRLGAAPRATSCSTHPTSPRCTRASASADGHAATLELVADATAILAEQPVRVGAALRGASRRFAIGPFVLEVRDAQAYEPEDATEARLIASLRDDPGDADARAVYADWLEARGLDGRAKLLRGEPGADELAPTDDAAWRAVAADVPIQQCGLDWLRLLDLGEQPPPPSFEPSCPKRWSGLAVTADDCVRHCPACDRPVHWCTTALEVRDRASGCTASRWIRRRPANVETRRAPSGASRAT